MLGGGPLLCVLLCHTCCAPACAVNGVRAWPDPSITPHPSLLHPSPSPPQLRYVLMPGQTDQPEDVEAMVRFCAGKRAMQAVEVLPYHLLGVEVRWCGCCPWWRHCAGC